MRLLRVVLRNIQAFLHILVCVVLAVLTGCLSLSLVALGSYDYTDFAYAQDDRMDASLSIDMPLPGESVEWRMSSGAVIYDASDITFQIIEITDVYSEVERWVSVDIIDESQGSANVVASGVSLSQLRQFSFECPHASDNGCILTAALHMNRDAGDEVRGRRISIRWMFTVQDLAKEQSSVADDTQLLGRTGISVAMGVLGVATLTLIGVVFAIVHRRLQRKETTAQ